MDDDNFLLDMKVDPDTATQMNESSRWAKLMAVLTLVGCGLFFLMIFLVWGSLVPYFLTMSEMSDGTATVLKYSMVVVAVIFICIVSILMNFLIRAANGIRKGIRLRDGAIFNVGLANLRNYFTMYGVLAILQLLFSLMGWLAQ